MLGTRWAASLPGPSRNALRPPQGPGQGLLDPILKFLLCPRGCAVEPHPWARTGSRRGLCALGLRRDLRVPGLLRERGGLWNLQPQLPTCPVLYSVPPPALVKIRLSISRRSKTLTWKGT